MRRGRSVAKSNPDHEDDDKDGGDNGRNKNGSKNQANLNPTPHLVSLVFGLQLISKDDAVAQPGVDDDYGDDKERMVTNMMMRRRLVMINEEQKMVQPPIGLQH